MHKEISALTDYNERERWWSMPAFFKYFKKGQTGKDK